jgi:hypothetical protein
MREVDMLEDIIQCIVLALCTQDAEYDFKMGWDVESIIYKAVAEQDSIGWLNLMEGKVSSKWQALQGGYYTTINSKRTSC